jgi:hypothetical protein
MECDPGVGVRDEADQATPAPGASGHLERVDDYLGAHVRRHPPAHDHAAKRVNDEAHVRHPRPGWHVGQVRYLQSVGMVGGGVATHEVRGPPRVGIGPGGEHFAPARHVTDAQLTHQSCHVIADVVSDPAGGFPELVGP